jgi:purine nucleosidase
MGAPGSDIDDGFALALAHAEPNVQIDMITTVKGNTDVESATNLSLELAQRLGCTQVPIYRGAAAPLSHPGPARPARPDVGNSNSVGLAPHPGYAAVKIAEHVMANPGEVTIVAIGPLTNVATAIVLEPRIAAAVKEIVIMGGSFLGTTGGSVPAEFNVWLDPEAAATVLRSGASQRWVGLDVALKVRLTREHARHMLDARSEFARFAGEATLSWIDCLRDRNPGDPKNADSCAMHDPLAMAVLPRPELVTWQEAHVEIVTGDGIARGITVADLLGYANPPAPNCRIAVDVDSDAFMEYFLGTLTSLD